MKNLILFLVLVTLSFPKDWLGGYQNPNGKPFTLTIGMNWERWDRQMNGKTGVDKYANEARIDIKFPIHSLLTLKLSRFNDRGYYRYTTGTTSDGHPYIDLSSKNNWITSLGGELHLPIYKLWEK